MQLSKLVLGQKRAQHSVSRDTLHSLRFGSEISPCLWNVLCKRGMVFMQFYEVH